MTRQIPANKPHPISQPQWGELEIQAREILSRMTLEEKVGQMSGDSPLLRGILAMARRYNPTPIHAGENKRLGVPGIRFSDGPRGVVMGGSTCFPVAMARGATFDPELEERVGEVIGIEARSQGANLFAGVCINLLRHPAWGRAQETYGEDSFHLGEMGSALVRGTQRHLMACVKHYACNSIENSRFKVNVRIAPRTLHEIYLPHFKKCIQAGAAAVMSAYNKVNGDYCGQNPTLLRSILKGEWGFKGFVMSDFFQGIYDARLAALAGLDMEMPFRFHYARNLRKLVERGEVSPGVIDEAVMRILVQKLRFTFAGEEAGYSAEKVFCSAHRLLALETARKSIVLLKNDSLDGHPLLPLRAEKIHRVAVIGRLAKTANIGDHGSSRVHPPEVITPWEGLRSLLPAGVELSFHDGRNADRAARAAKNADCVVIFAGYNHNDEGEKIQLSYTGGDRSSLCLKARDEELILRVAAANPRTAVVMIGGSAIITEGWKNHVPAILMAWYPGSEGGTALAEILLGRVNPSGKLPCVFPRSEDQLPAFPRNPNSIEYGYYHGYRLMEKEGETPAFPFGFGLSYTTYRYSNLRISKKDHRIGETIRVSVEIANTGTRAGEEIAQLYIGYPGTKIDRPRYDLRGFKRVAIAPGETVVAEFEIDGNELAYFDEFTSSWKVEPIEYQIRVGSSSVDASMLFESFRITA